MNQTTMNQATEDVIEFLNFPESDFGTTPLDAEILQDPALLRERVAALVAETRPSADSHALAVSLQERMGEADWAAVSGEMQKRLQVTAGFFDPVEENIRQATK